MKSGYDRIGRSVTVEHAKRSCLDKRPYPSKNEARDAAARNLKTYGTVLKPYRCTLCGGFHLATKKTRKGKAPRPARIERGGAKQYNRLPEEG